MSRLCGQCGYDVTATPVRAGGRQCPECGTVGRGYRRPVGLRVDDAMVGWVAGAVLKFVLPYSGAVVCVGIGKVGLGAPGDDWVKRLAVASALGCVVWAGISGYGAAVAVRERMERALPRRWRRGRELVVMAGVVVLDCTAAVGGVAVLAAMG